MSPVGKPAGLSLCPVGAPTIINHKSSIINQKATEDTKTTEENLSTDEHGWTQRGLATLGRNQEFVEWESPHNVLRIKTLQVLKGKIEHEKQRFEGLYYEESRFNHVIASEARQSCLACHSCEACPERSRTGQESRAFHPQTVSRAKAKDLRRWTNITGQRPDSALSLITYHLSLRASGRSLFQSSIMSPRTPIRGVNHQCRPRRPRLSLLRPLSDASRTTQAAQRSPEKSAGHL